MFSKFSDSVQRVHCGAYMQIYTHHWIFLCLINGLREVIRHSGWLVTALYCDPRSKSGCAWSFSLASYPHGKDLRHGHHLHSAPTQIAWIHSNLSHTQTHLYHLQHCCRWYKAHIQTMVEISIIFNFSSALLGAFFLIYSSFNLTFCFWQVNYSV